jgi:hypothetical protein
MAAFTIDMSSPLPSSPFPSGRRIGGPGQGDHLGDPKNQWYNRFGMDIGASVGTEVRAAFDAKITKFQPAIDKGKEYGAQLFMRDPTDMMGGFYTHITGVPASVQGINAQVHRGDLLGTVQSFAGIPTHLHLALVEIIGGWIGPGDTSNYKGVDNLYQKFLDTADTTIVFSVTFNQDGSPPTL